MVRDFHVSSVAKLANQILAAEKRLPTHLFACVGGGSTLSASSTSFGVMLTSG